MRLDTIQDAAVTIGRIGIHRLGVVDALHFGIDRLDPPQQISKPYDQRRVERAQLSSCSITLGLHAIVIEPRVA